MERFQVYKRRFEGGLMHITSLEAVSRLEAIKFVQDPKRFGGHGQYYVTGLTRCTDEDISSNFPFHILRRIKNHGIPVKTKGSLYDSHRLQQIRDREKILSKTRRKVDQTGSGKPVENDSECGQENTNGSPQGSLQRTEGTAEGQLTLNF